MSWINSFLKSTQDLLGTFPLSWVDFITLAVVGFGFVRGRKRGLSEEILDLFKWLIIVGGGAFLYRPLGDLMNQKPILSTLTFYMMAYLLIALGVWLVFNFIKKRLGQKLIESDIFGRFEFYGGMGSGAVRWLCMYFFVLSLLHAPFYSDAERAERKKEMEYNYGSDFFPSVVSIQDTVFHSSLTGKGAIMWLEPLLMEPVSGDAKPLRGDNSLARRRERAVDDVFGQK
jgi:uncharacterized membrane protein required for colicin V production